MLWKLSMTGLKSRIRDYMILFSGLVIASGIFYMFESLATNKEFLTSNSTISSIVIIFHFGTVLLSIITLVYILYANSFLMTLRQKDYAMFMMLGAKSRKIAQMIFIETITIGFFASVLGSLMGMGLTVVVSQLLTKQMDIQVSHFSALNGTALLFTLVFFSVLFLLASFINAVSIVKKPIIQLLTEAATPSRLKKHSGVLFLEALIGLASLAIAYYMMAHIMEYQFFAIGVALVTTILGTYLMFHSIVVFVLSLLKKSDNYRLKKINNFTVSQLSFRVRDYTQILSMVSILFALALGALSVGLGFRNEIVKTVNFITPYDLVLNNAQEIPAEKLDALSISSKRVYRQKEDAQTIYYSSEEFDKQPFLMNEQDYTTRTAETKQLTADMISDNAVYQDELRNLELPDQKVKEIQFLSQAEFEQLTLPTTQLQLITVENFKTDLSQLESLVEMNETNNPSLNGLDGVNAFSQKYYVYQVYNGMSSGFEFMGFFLGIAFLTMLASCLMFKILSGANSDKTRYHMLRKIGSRQHLLQASIRKEIGVLFLIPGLLGTIHVLFGLAMFDGFLANPYDQIWLPISIFIVLYAIYYVVTVQIYTRIVLPKELVEST